MALVPCATVFPSCASPSAPASPVNTIDQATCLTLFMRNSALVALTIAIIYRNGIWDGRRSEARASLSVHEFVIRKV